MKRKIFAMFLIMAFLACLLPSTALAAPGRPRSPWNDRESHPFAVPYGFDSYEEGEESEDGPYPYPYLYLYSHPDLYRDEFAEGYGDGSTEVYSDSDAFDSPCDSPYCEGPCDGACEGACDSWYCEAFPGEDGAEGSGSSFPEGGMMFPEAFPEDFVWESDEEAEPLPPEPTEEEAAAAAALAALIEPDSAEEPVLPDEEALPSPDAQPESLTVSADETVYAYEGMTVFNNGGTVYSNLALVYNNGGVVYSNGGTVYNNAGIVYANGGEVYANAGTVYSNSASVSAFGGNVQESSVYGYHELRLADFYEPYVMISGLEVLPGSEGSVITEDSVCTIAPIPGYMLVNASADAGKLVWEEDGSLTLSDVDADVLLDLTLRADTPFFNLVSGRYEEPQTVEIMAPDGCEIWYTTDGNMPDVGNAIYYDGPFTVSEDCMLIAVAAAAGVESSDPVAVSLRFPAAQAAK
ncbi:MAG: chitobiase/beta-hexosaminidase C-terminal domain-containing protein [Oscillospiraceae bacterium]|nr:chitobiase/beta-hexosaminidase C-terminal domain-containing protein [Oscillospiraceae bacterium]